MTLKLLLQQTSKALPLTDLFFLEVSPVTQNEVIGEKNDNGSNVSQTSSH